MSLRHLFKAPLGVIGRPLPVGLALVLLVSACIPIPSTTTQYVANRADMTIPAGDGGGCGFGPNFRENGYREFGEVRVSMQLSASTPPDPGTSPELTITFSDYNRENRTHRLSFDTSLVRLEEGGRSYRVVNAQTPGANPIIAARVNSRQLAKPQYTLTFPAGTGVDDTLRFVFGEGAIRINGAPIAFPPISYQRKEAITVYMFPCIPS